MESKDIKQLAIDVVENKVFGSWSLDDRNIDLMHLIFLPLAMIDQAGIDDLKNKNIVHLYEYYEGNTFGRCINGFPIFSSFRGISKDDYIEMAKYCKDYIELKEKFTNL